jgi:hypothetical protein
MKLITENLSKDEQLYFSKVLNDSNAPDLEGMWELMDAVWDEYKCDPEVMDERIASFYGHPVWLLNGMFIEQHTESISHRRTFTEYVEGLKPKRVADFGGGYGSLARMIGASCMDAEVHIIEPHPRAAAVLLADKTSNVRYVTEFSGEYDVLIATDVFEHVLDPLSLIESSAAHLRIGGEYLIANCFCPVIKCHLSSTLHFRWSWDAAMAAMNMQPGKAVSYGRGYKRVGPVSSAAARNIEQSSMRYYAFIAQMPRCIQGVVWWLLVFMLRWKYLI